MGREIPSNEHMILGTVTVGRPTRPNIILPGEILEIQQERLIEIARLKSVAAVATEQQVQIVFF